MRDYFTIEEFRSFAGPRGGGKWPDTEIDEAQAEVIDSLEAWAGSAWPNVVARGTGTIAAADKTLTLATGTFTDVDAGQGVRVVGAGALGADLVSTIATVTDGTHAELADAAGTSIVTPADAFLDGDGTAASPRSLTQEIESGPRLLFASDIPVISLDRFRFTTSQNVTDDLDTDDYMLDKARGVLRLAVSVRRGAGFYTLDYSYGFTTCPRLIKRPAMAATLGLLHDSSPSKIPPKTAQMTTEATTFVFAPPGSAFSGPWPWDAEASEAVRSYWGRHRPRRAGAA